MEIYPKNYDFNKPFLVNLNKVSTPFPAHRHDFLEFSYVTKGKGAEIINGKKHTIQKGTFTLLLPYQVHELYPISDQPLYLYNCNLGLEAFFGANKLSRELNEMIFEIEQELPSYCNFTGEQAAKIENIFKEMLEEYKEKQLWSELLLKAKLAEIFVIFDRMRRKNFKNKTYKQSISKKDNHSYIWKIVYYIHNYYKKDISLNKLSEEFGISSSHLSTTFKKHFGENFHSFVNSIRIKHACGLLVSTNMKVIDIAIEAGFNSYATFSRVFRQKMGMSATEYSSLNQN